MFPHDFALTTPDKPAIIMGSTGEVITYRQLDEAAIRLSNVLRDAGLNPGDHVALAILPIEPSGPGTPIFLLCDARIFVRRNTSARDQSFINSSFVAPSF